MAKQRLAPHEIPTMKALCKSCPFQEGNSVRIREKVKQRVITESSQICHSTEGKTQQLHLCKGARDFQAQVFYQAGFLEEPTDECWRKKFKELNKMD